jgi:hypothetical protein
MKGKVLTTPAMVILSALITLSALAGIIRGKMINILKVLNILMEGDLSILPISMRSARKKSCARLVRTSADVI